MGRKLRYIIALALMLTTVFGMQGILNREVKADDPEINFGDTMSCDFTDAAGYWFQYNPTKDSYLYIQVTGSDMCDVFVYRDAHFENEIVSLREVTRYALYPFCESGKTYYILVRRCSGENVGDTKITFNKHPEIKLGETVSCDYNKQKYYWFQYTPTKNINVALQVTGSDVSTVEAHKIGHNYSLVGTRETGNNASAKVTCYYGETYYFCISSYGNTTIAGDVKAKLVEAPKTKIVDINKDSFPDDVFRDFVLEKIDIDDNNVLTSDEVQATTIISLYKKDISSLKGIEYFTEVDFLQCNFSNLKSLDLSKNTKMRTLYIGDNPNLTSLNISKCKDLATLDCPNCGLTEMELSNNLNLQNLDCGGNKIKTLHLDLPRLREVSVNGNGLESLTFSERTDNVKNLECQDNKLTSLSLGEWELNTLDCSNNQLSSLDVSSYPNLYKLSYKGNNFSKLDISSNMSLVMVHDTAYWHEDTGYWEGDLPKNKSGKLQYDPNVTLITGEIDPYEKVVQLDNINFPDGGFLHFMTFHDENKDGWLDRYEISIRSYMYADNWETISDLTGIEYLTNLEKFGCSNNKLTKADMSWDAKLKVFRCSINQITSLDLSKNKKLKSLECYDNQISSLDLSNNPLLQHLVCYKNKITQLDIRKCPKLVNLVKVGTRTEHDGIIEYKDDDGNILAFDKTVNLITGLPTPTPTVAPTTNPTVTAKPTSKPTGTPAEPTKAVAVSLALNKKTANVICGKTLTLKATLKGASSKITWKSSDTKIATVDANGKITAKMAGTVTITASAAGKTATCDVTVLYKDVTNSKDFWYAPTNYLTAKGVVKGYDNQTKFKPANKCTRAQMVTFIWRLMGEPKPKTSKCKFSDVKKTDYFYKACIWGNENHIVEGYKDGTFGPQIVCARRHAVTFLWRLANKPKPTSTKNKFKDVKKSDYFYTATLWASEQNILAGYKDGTFKPNGDCLRRQMVTFLYKYDKFVNGKG